MAEDNHRSVDLKRVGPTKFEVTNARGGTLVTGSGQDADFMPGELLLAAIGACTGVDVDILASRRAEPLSFSIEVTATKTRDDLGNHLSDLAVHYDIVFPDGEGGDAAREVLPTLIKRSRETLCTVGRTIEIGTPITDHLVDEDRPSA